MVVARDFRGNRNLISTIWKIHDEKLPFLHPESVNDIFLTKVFESFSHLCVGNKKQYENLMYLMLVSFLFASLYSPDTTMIILMNFKDAVSLTVTVLHNARIIFDNGNKSGISWQSHKIELNNDLTLAYLISNQSDWVGSE